MNHLCVTLLYSCNGQLERDLLDGKPGPSLAVALANVNAHPKRDLEAEAW